MPWQEVSAMEQRKEFVRLAGEGVNRRELCRRFGIHPSTAYKWLGRGADLADRSRRPHTSPRRTAEAIEARILELRALHPVWGARKIQRCVAREGLAAPAPSVVHAILQRHGKIDLTQKDASARLRFEMEAPNKLWQMDFKGWVRLSSGEVCHPLTVLDDHSRYAVGLQACANEQGVTVQSRLERIFLRYGLPDAFFVDNGTPWGDSAGARWTKFGVWLLKLGVDLIHSRPYHPQSRGKNERFNRTVLDEVLALKRFDSFHEVQCAFDAWRHVYNLERPHQALGLDVPASRYRPSTRSMPSRLPEVEYDDGETVRSVPTTKDYISFKGRHFKVPQAFRGERVAIRPLSSDGSFGIYFAAHLIVTIDLTLS